MIRFPRAALVLTLLLALAPLGGCQETLRANVTRFSSLSTVPSGQSVMILPEGPQIGSLEFQHYAELVAAALGNLGFKPTANDAVHPADFVVILHYGQVGRKTEIIPSPDFVSPNYWWLRQRPYYDNQSTVFTTYSQMLEVQLLDGTDWRKGTKRAVFEGRAVSDSTIADVTTAMPYLVKAVFDGFPGSNGVTVTRDIPITNR